MKPRDIFGIIVRGTAFFFVVMAVQQSVSHVIEMLLSWSFEPWSKGYLWAGPISSFIIGVGLFALATPLERLAYRSE